MRKTFNLDEEKRILRHDLMLLAGIAFFIFFIVLTLGLLSLIPDFINDTTSSSNLGGFGSFFNTVIALTGLVTVGLVFYGVRVQSLEFQAMNEKLQVQIESLEKEGAITRAIGIIENWEELEDKNSYLTGNQKNFIKKTYSLLNNYTAKNIDFSLVSSYLEKDGVLKKLNDEIRNIEVEVMFKKGILDDSFSQDELSLMGHASLENLVIKKEREFSQQRKSLGNLFESEEDVEKYEYYDPRNARQVVIGEIEEQITNYSKQIKSLNELINVVKNVC